MSAVCNKLNRNKFTVFLNGLWHVQFFAKLPEPDDNDDNKAVKDRKTVKYQIICMSRAFEWLQQGLHQLSKTKTFYDLFMERVDSAKNKLVAYLKSNSANLCKSKVCDSSVSHPSYFTIYVQCHLPEILKYCNCTDPGRLLFHQVHSFVGHRGHAVVLEKYDITSEELGATGHAAVLEKYVMTSEELGAIGHAAALEELYEADRREAFERKSDARFIQLQEYYAINGHFRVCRHAHS